MRALVSFNSFSNINTPQKKTFNIFPKIIDIFVPHNPKEKLFHIHAFSEKIQKTKQFIYLFISFKS